MRTLTSLLLSAGLLSCAAPGSVSKASATRSTLTFIEDDFERALGEANQKHLPLFVDAWAPW